MSFTLCKGRAKDRAITNFTGLAISLAVPALAVRVKDLPDTPSRVKHLIDQFNDSMLITQMAEFGPERGVADESIHVNLTD